MRRNETNGTNINGMKRDEVNKLTPEAIAHKGPAIFHIRINVRANRKKQEFPFGSMQSMLAGSAPVAKNKTNGNSKL